VRNHAVIADVHEIAHKGMRLYFAAFPDCGTALNFDKRSYKRALIYPATVKVGGLDYRYVCAELNVDDANRTQFGGTGHKEVLSGRCHCRFHFR
jgi:hypothetical protein